MKDQDKKAKKKPKKKDDPEVARAKKNLGIESEEEKEQREHNERVEQQAAADAANAPHINRKGPFPKAIYITLEPEEAQEANRRLLQALDDVDARENDKAMVMKEHNELIKEADGVVLAIRKELKNGRTEVVQVMEVKDFDAGTYMLSRVDTNEVLERRDLTDEERQPDLNMESPASAASSTLEEGAIDGTMSQSAEAFERASAEADTVKLERLRKEAYDGILAGGGSLDAAEEAANAVTLETIH